MENQKIVLNTIEEALEDFRQGKFVIVVYCSNISSLESFNSSRIAMAAS